MRKNTKILYAFLVLSFSLASPAAFAESTIVAHEDTKYFFRDGRMEKYEGQYEITYFLDLDKNQLVRTRIYDYLTKKITPDDTVYQIQTQLNSNPSNAARFGLTPAIRAFSQPGPDSSELLIIKDDVVESIVSEPRSVVLSYSKRLK